MIYLRSFEINEIENSLENYPFNLPLIQSGLAIRFRSPVTFFVGENGSGKSTLLEAIAASTGSIIVGSDQLQNDSTLNPAKKLAKFTKLTWNKRTHKGFFLRAEDFFGYAKRMAQIKAELQEDLDEVQKQAGNRSALALNLSKIPFQREIHEIQQKKADHLEHISHGESFLQLFQSRFVPDGLYLLDEPEAPLSPLRQLTLISLLKEMVSNNSQFIIVTHSPILMAFPNAELLNFDEIPIKSVQYENLQHVEIMKGFLNNPKAYLNHL